ncbi:MAG: hypothetical protein RJA22_3013 [Verrucomicrobiota bacterium]|jgi:extracellular factor (EF) 3-hydroxypalmitic acid methyl ester biosynthesis protein
MENTPPKARAIEKPSEAICVTPQGDEVRGVVQRVTRHSALIEFYNPELVFRASEVLNPCRLFLHERPVYEGRAVVTGLQATSTSVSLEVSLDPAGIPLVPPDPAAAAAGGWAREFGEFLQAWQPNHIVRPEYKVVVADLVTFLADLRLWLERATLALRGAPEADQPRLLGEAADGFARRALPAFTTLFERCEAVTRRLAPDEVPAHRSFLRRQLHPLVLCSPFCHRTFFKPLGYAGDYEMVNMILRDPREGGSLFAQVLNCWFLAQAPAEAHRNRIAYLEQKLAGETARIQAAGRPARVYNLGCGPADEIQRFMAAREFADHATFTLADFSEETLARARATLEQARQRARRRTPLNFVRRSVNQLLKEATLAAPVAPSAQYDLVYCAGLTDYLVDPVCRRLIHLLHSWVAPGGLLIITNVDGSNPRIETMEYVLEWHLIYRSAPQLAALAPAGAHPDDVRVTSDVTGVNNYLEIRRPAEGAA